MLSVCVLCRGLSYFPVNVEKKYFRAISSTKSDKKSSSDTLVDISSLDNRRLQLSLWKGNGMFTVIEKEQYYENEKFVT